MISNKILVLKTLVIKLIHIEITIKLKLFMEIKAIKVNLA
jgi:hypothetical protein